MGQVKFYLTIITSMSHLLIPSSGGYVLVKNMLQFFKMTKLSSYIKSLIVGGKALFVLVLIAAVRLLLLH